jgi:hypothetical protein
MKGKRRISSFTAGATKEVDINDRRLILAVDVYQSDAAKMVKLFPHRHVTRSGDYGTTATPGFDLLSLVEDTWGTAWYRRPFTKDLAETGDFSAKQIIQELLLKHGTNLLTPKVRCSSRILGQSSSALGGPMEIYMEYMELTPEQNKNTLKQ